MQINIENSIKDTSLQVEKLKLQLTDIETIAFVAEEFSCLADDNEVLYIKTCYVVLDDSYTEVLDRTYLRASLRNLCNLKVPSNIKMFGWRMFLNKLYPRDQLFIRGILVGARDNCCAFCFQEEEDNHHLFRMCAITRRVQDIVESWLGN